MAIPALARLAAAVLTNEDGRRTAGKVLALILSPLIILAAFLCCFGDGASRHNNAVVSAAFYGAEFSDKVPKEYRTHITEMQEAFSLLDSATVYVNQKAEEGPGTGQGCFLCPLLRRQRADPCCRRPLRGLFL